MRYKIDALGQVHCDTVHDVVDLLAELKFIKLSTLKNETIAVEHETEPLKKETPPPEVETKAHFRETVSHEDLPVHKHSKIDKKVADVKLDCPKCGDTFSPNTTRQKFCSKTCSVRYFAERQRERMRQGKGVTKLPPVGRDESLASFRDKDEGISKMRGTVVA